MVYSFWNLDLLPIIIRKSGIEIKETSPEGQVQHATKIQNHDAPKQKLCFRKYYIQYCYKQNLIKHTQLHSFKIMTVLNIKAYMFMLFFILLDHFIPFNLLSLCKGKEKVYEITILSACHPSFKTLCILQFKTQFCDNRMGECRGSAS